MVINNERLYAHADGLGNVIALTDAAQAVRRQYGYDDWGNSGGTSGTLALPDADRARWKGALWMGPELDLYYMRNRWYEPATGRFLSEDPKGLAGGINPTIFAQNNPITNRDPNGLECEVVKFPLTDPKTGKETGEIGEKVVCTDITLKDLRTIARFIGGEMGQRFADQLRAAIISRGGIFAGGVISLANRVTFQRCTGLARSLEGNPATVGGKGGIAGRPVRSGSVAVDPFQFGGKQYGYELAPFASSVHGTVGSFTFNGITDVIGGKSPIKGMNVRAALRSLYPGQLLLEGVGGPDQGENVPVTIFVPTGFGGCPSGTSVP